MINECIRFEEAGMTNLNMASARLMRRGPYEAVDELEESLLRAFLSLQPQLTPPYQLSTLSPAQHAHLTQALLCGIILGPTSAPSHVTHLTAITTDGYASCVFILLRLVNEFYPKLLDHARTQILWLLRQLIVLSAADVDTLCLALLRQVAGGDLTPGNVWLATQLLDVLKSNWTWFTGIPSLSTTALYTYLRLLPDHAMVKGVNFHDLKQIEGTFCVQLLRERFQDCLNIGRDLIRLLQDVAYLPELEMIWRDLFSNTVAFKTSSFTDIAQVYVVRTPNRYLISRVTPEMEIQIRFMLTHVRMGSQRRYQTWFAQRFLSSPESETLVCDLIRFICCVIHPTNQTLQSDVVPRWAVVGWLLKCCKSNHVEANAKLALFNDWLFFMSKSDNIMNIEPAILLMVYSIPKYVDMTHSLLEFLFLLVEHYDPSRKDLIQRGVTSSIDILVGKGVVRSLEPLSACNLVASWLREKLVYYFSSYCKNDSSEGSKHAKTDLHQELTMSDPVQHHISGVAMKASQPIITGPWAGTTKEKGLGVVTDPLLANAQFSDSETGHDVADPKPGEVEMISTKRRRLGPMENLLAETRQNLDRLSEAISKSQESAVGALEKLLGSFIATSDQMFAEKLSTHARAESCDTTPSLPGSGSGVPDPSALTMTSFASQVTEVLKKGGYEFFGPLQKKPSDKPEGDETSSITSTLLRLYIANRRSQPQLRQLLVCWHREGLAVGARLLCYVSRLAEEIESPSTRSFRSKCTSSTGTDEKSATTSCSTDEEFCECVANGDGDEAEFADVIAESSYECRKHGNVSSRAQCSPRVRTTFRRSSCSTDFNMAGDMPHALLRAAVSDAFKTYEEFLRHASSFSLQGDSTISPSQDPQSSTSNTHMKYEGPATDGDNSDTLLFSDLETCFLWHATRFFRVLPSVYCYLPQLSISNDNIFRMLVSTIDSVELSSYEFRLILGEFSIIGDQQDGLARSIRNSLKWDFIEQQIFWRLLIAENQASLSTIMFVLKACSSLINPQVNSEALSGLLLLLRYQEPSPQLVSAVLSLPSTFGGFAAVLLTSWMSAHHSQLLASLQNLNSGCLNENVRKGEDENDMGTAGLQRFSNTAVNVLLNSFENTEFLKNVDERKIRMNRTAEVRNAVLKLIGVGNCVAASPLQGPIDKVSDNQDDRFCM